MKKVRIGITIGDPAGIGPEITKKALADRSIKRLANYLIIDSSAKKKIILGHPNKISGACAIENIDTAIDLIKAGAIDAIVTAPVSKEMISSSRRGFSGHTEYLAMNFKTKNFAMAFISKHFRLSLVTTHLSLKAVSRAITVEKVFSTLKVTRDTLMKYFKLKNPLLAVCGLNPHAGEGGLLGKEEKRIIIPAIKHAKKIGINAVGPIPADALFYELYHKKFDCGIAMYHDQGLIPVKMIDKFNAVNMTFGLPIIRTSPSHGTAFEIAGKKIASAETIIEAIKLAAYCVKQSRN